MSRRVGFTQQQQQRECVRQYNPSLRESPTQTGPMSSLSSLKTSYNNQQDTSSNNYNGEQEVGGGSEGGREWQCGGRRWMQVLACVLRVVGVVEMDFGGSLGGVRTSERGDWRKRATALRLAFVVVVLLVLSSSFPSCVLQHTPLPITHHTYTHTHSSLGPIPTMALNRIFTALERRFGNLYRASCGHRAYGT
jgi:hypothetical protein